MTIEFSVLMSVYTKESPAFLHDALESVWTNQTHKPSEIVLVKDGPLSKELNTVIDQWQKYIGDKLKVIALTENKGLGVALNIGLENCSYEYVARMDTDDVSTPRRFELLINEFTAESDLSLCGSFIREFKTSDHEYAAVRSVPTKMSHIKSSGMLRNPFNHPSVMFKKSSIQSVDGYKPMPYFEDYYLWLRVISKGYKAKNIAQPLVNMRIDNGQLERRSGVPYAIHEISFYKQLQKDGIITYPLMLLLMTLRVPLRVLPKKILAQFYLMMRSTRASNS